MAHTSPTIASRELSEAECLHLLASHNLGRVGFVRDGQPLIFPVNYALHNGVISFRTGTGTKLDHIPDAAVAFEIDGFDYSAGEAWSVLVQGTGFNATTSLEAVAVAARGAIPYPLAPGAKLNRLGIAPRTITGRRFPFTRL